MTAYQDSLKTEADGQGVLHDWLRHCCNATVVINAPAHFGRELQQFGDMVVQWDGHKEKPIKYIELKIENKYTGNLFVETWSNKARKTPGWIINTKAEHLFYYFISNDTLISLDMMELKDFIYQVDSSGKVNAYKYREVKQGKCQQMNDTWGLLVPIDDLKDLPSYRVNNPAEKLRLRLEHAA